MSTLIQDLRYGLRMLRKNPGFTAVAVLTLGLGIGANTVIFSVVNGVLLSPLPYPHPEQLVALYSRTPQFSRASISYPNFLDWVRENRTFSALAAYRADDFNLTGMGEPERLAAEMVSASFFPVLGVRPAIGRWFTPEEDQVGAAPVVLISGGLWERKFGASPDAVGKRVTLNGVGYTIVGVVPPRFWYSGNNFHMTDLYTPIGQWNDPTFRDRRAGMGTNAAGRLRAGVTFEQAKADMEGIGRRLAEQYPEADKETGITLRPLKENVVGDIQPFLLALAAAVGFVLLIACINVANLLLARSTGRTRELAIRTAIGASRGRLAQQLLTESVLLAVAGGGFGLLMASWGLQAALRLVPEALPRAQEVRLNGHVLWFTLAASVLAGILFGLVPALRALDPEVHQTLKEGGRGASAARHRAQRVFVVVEMALALVLLAGAGLMVRSLVSLWRVDPGFDPHNLLTFSLSFPTPASNPDAVRATWRAIHDRLSAIPGVEAAALSLGSQPMASDSELPFWPEGQPKPLSQGDMKVTLFYDVQPDYLKVMRIPLQRGRFLTSDDNEHSRPVTVIDERFAGLYFHGQDPIGKRINFELGAAAAEIVGVVGHVKQWGLDEDSTSPVQAQCYFPLSQLSEKFIPLVAPSVGVAVRTAGSPLAEVGSIREAMRQIDSQPVMYETQTMEATISDSLAAQRFSMVLMSIFAALALVMASIGIYGVISYFTGQRMQEIGIRMALGAQRVDVLRLVVGQGFRLALAGVGIGIAAGLGLARFLSSLLFGVKPTDPFTFMLVSLLLAAVALLACYIPARRATKVDPMVALRYE